MSGTLIALGFFTLLAAGMFGAGFKAGLRLIGTMLMIIGVFLTTIISIIAQAIVFLAVLLLALAVIAVIRALLRHQRERRRRGREWPYDPYGPGNPYDWRE